MTPEPPARKATSIPEPPARIPKSIPAPIVQQLTCTCLKVLQVVNGVARCTHEIDAGNGIRYTQVIRHRVSITSELVGGGEVLG